MIYKYKVLCYNRKKGETEKFVGIVIADSYGEAANKVFEIYEDFDEPSLEGIEIHSFTNEDVIELDDIFCEFMIGSKEEFNEILEAYYEAQKSAATH